MIRPNKLVVLSRNFATNHKQVRFNKARAYVSVYDLPDQPYRDWFEDEMSPDEAAVAALEEAGYGDGSMSADFDAFYEDLWE